MPNHPLIVAMRFALSTHAPGGCLFAQSLHHPTDCPNCGLRFAIACLEGDSIQVGRFIEKHPGLEPMTLDGLLNAT